MGHSKFISKDILNIVSLRVWKSYLRKLNDEFKKVYYISFNRPPNIRAQHSNGLSIQWYPDIKLWFFNGKIHRNEIHGPAYKRVDGYYKSWRKHGQFHRINGPAVEYSNGDKLWYQNDVKHRENGPAVENANGTTEWYFKGRLHRTDGPAIEFANGNKYWYLNGHLHNTEGPAIEFVSGEKHWYLDGQKLSEHEFNKRK